MEQLEKFDVKGKTKEQIQERIAELDALIRNSLAKLQVLEAKRLAEQKGIVVESRGSKVSIMNEDYKLSNLKRMCRDWEYEL